MFLINFYLSGFLIFMKILFVLNDTLKYGGTESVCLNYLNHINKDKYQIDFLLHTTEEEFKNTEICYKLKEQGIKIYFVTPRRINLHKNLKELEYFFKNNNYDIIHSHADAASYIILKIAKKCGHKNLIAHSHSTAVSVNRTGLFGILHKLYLDYCKILLRKLTKNYMACTEKAGEWLFGKKNVEQGSVFILKNAIDLDLFRFNYELRNKVRNELNLTDSIVLGHIGRFSYEKNHEFIIEVFKKICMISDKYKLLLIGTGERFDQIVEMVDGYGLTSKVIFLGKTNEAYKYYNAMDFFIFPSLFEGLSLSLIEVQANGLRCIVTDNNNVTKKSRITQLVEFKKLDNIELWANYILNSINYDRTIDYSNELTNNGYNIIVETKKLENYYNELIKYKS